MAKKPSLSIHLNGVVFRNNNRRITVLKRKNEEEPYEEANVLGFVALTTEVGKEPGVSHGLHAKDKVKFSELRLTDEAVIDLYHSLGYYIKDVLKKES